MSTTDRRWEIDALRGLMLVLMTITHLPTRLADPLGQPFGYVSAAEGFVLLSGYMAGLVYARRQRKSGDEVMRTAFLRRALVIYACQALLMFFLFSVIAAVGVTRHEEAITSMLGFYFDKPLTALLSGMLLVYNPPLLDILPMYIIFMIVSPVLLLHGTPRGWIVILAVSIVLWLGTLFGGVEWLAQAVGAQTFYWNTGAFSILAWQFIWVLGLWMGSRQAMGVPVAGRFPQWMVGVAVAVALVGFFARQLLGQNPLDGQPLLAMLIDKWKIGPLRLLDFMALTVVTMHFGPRLVARLPKGVPALEFLGRASLPVFCAHLVVVLLALALAGAVTPQRPMWVDPVILVATFVVLYAVAAVSAWLDRRLARQRDRWVQRRRMVSSPGSAGPEQLPAGGP